MRMGKNLPKNAKIKLLNDFQDKYLFNLKFLKYK